MKNYITEYPQFFTASILDWKKLLQPDKYKEIIISSFRYLVNNKRIKMNAFTIMPDHIHLIWQMQSLIHPDHVQRDFLKYTAQKIRHDLIQNNPTLLRQFRVDKADRDYQIWQRRPLSVELRTAEVYQQKLEYIHWNPVKAGFCNLPEQYKYSSASFYETGVDDWGFITHYNE
jgi:putative transposase